MELILLCCIGFAFCGGFILALGFVLYAMAQGYNVIRNIL